VNNKHTLVTIIIPCFNEEKFISQVINNIIEQDYPKEKTEILIIDGGSNDKTLNIIDEYTKFHRYITVLNNPNKIVPHALNMGINNSTGDIILRMDAHCIYPKNYITELVKKIFELHADNVGAILETRAGNSSSKALSIAYATSSIFGMGNSLFRVGTEKIVEADTVPFGCYRKEVFEKIGLFDEDLVRNQDDEFNARLIKNGGKIFLIPSVKVVYFARDTFSKLAKMFYEYGLFKPLVNKKVGKPSTLRQFAPPLFVLFLALFPILLYVPIIKYFSVGFIIFYLFFAAYFSIKSCVSNKKIGLLLMIPSFFLIHLSYGWGYIRGIFKFILFQQRVITKDFDINR
jgi:glycosyltransferase involved in cell wall biosynthesis